MANDLATLTVAAQPSHVGTCELCAAEGTVLAAVAVVRHSRGGAMEMSACDRCARAMRRLVAALGSSAVSAATLAEPVRLEVPRPAVEGAVTAQGVITPPPDPVRSGAVTGAPRLVAEMTGEVVSTDGRVWVGRVHGEPRSDGSWIGWLEFTARDGSETRRTRQETSQPNLGALTYWAGGLQPSFLEGAFNRAA